MIEIIFLSFLTSVYFISAGIFFSKTILDIKIKNDANIYQLALYGCIFLSFLALFLNYFINLGKNINILILITFLIYLIISQRKFLIKKILLLSLVISIFCSILIISDNTYRPDAGLYHLPYINILNNEKIIIGISNIHYRFGHTSIMQYVSALNNNWVFSEHGILLPTVIIYICFLLYLIHEIKFSNNKNLIFFNLLLLSFMCLKLNRYSDFGNDAPAHIYYFFLTSLAIKYYTRFDLSKMGEISILCAYLIYNKITLFLGSLLTLIFLMFKRKIFFFKIKPLIFILLFTFLFFTKNLLVSGCAVFPINKTCFSSLFWYDYSSNRGSNAETTMFENEAWTKGWNDQKVNKKNYEQYLSDFNWVKIWLNGHGKRTLNKLIPFLTFIILISIFIMFTKSERKKYEDKYKKFSEKNFIFSLLILNFFGILIWFFKFPVFRYGYSYIILFLILLICIISYQKIKLVNINILKKNFNYLLIFLIFVLVTKNFTRIIKNYDKKYNFSPWPKIYSEDENNFKKQNIAVKINDENIYFYSPNGLCYYNTAPCTHINLTKNAESGIKFKQKFGYKIFFFNR
tara:strand:- start:1930 stop:3648 length:1719 start_codon:yes stop_codon:yes gene_type:complete